MVGQQLENGQRGVGLDRVSDQMVTAGKRLLEQAQPLDNMIGRVDIERRAVALGQGFKRDLAAVQGALRLRVVKGARGWS